MEACAAGAPDSDQGRSGGSSGSQLGVLVPPCSEREECGAESHPRADVTPSSPDSPTEAAEEVDQENSSEQTEEMDEAEAVPGIACLLCVICQLWMISG
ncbi:UNVERIFIED_CONTAM: hypothetical protein FKN15_054759 [Acipenser sinensis]